MPSRYGVGYYGTGNYSAATTAELSATVSFTIPAGAADWTRNLAFAGDFPFAVTAEGDLRYEYGFRGTIEALFDTIGDIDYVLNKTLGGVTDFEVVFTGQLAVEAVFFGLSVIDVQITGFPYLGPYWNPEPSTGSWTPEDNTNDPWEPETVPGQWVPELAASDVWVPDTVNTRPWG